LTPSESTASNSATVVRRCSASGHNAASGQHAADNHTACSHHTTNAGTSCRFTYARLATDRQTTAAHRFATFLHRV
jgi:hypothetical protein